VTHVFVKFGEHIKRDQVDGMVGALMASGNVISEPDGRTFIVDVRRQASLEHLEKTLLGWEKWGFVRWHRTTQS
jgi:hypothetical protein